MTIYSSIYEKNTSYRPKGEINNLTETLGPVVAQDSPNLDNRMSKATAEGNGNSTA